MKKGEMLSKAILIATLGHEGQFDKGGNPYILHPLTVMHKLKSADEERQSAAVLHDVMEDCSGKKITIGDREVVISFAMLKEEGFSDRVINCVRRLTKMPGQTYEEYKIAVFGDEDAMSIKAEDLRTNSDLRRLKGITEKDVARAAKYMVFYSEIMSRIKQ